MPIVTKGPTMRYRPGSSWSFRKGVMSYSIDKNSISDSLYYYDYGFNIPSGMIITGIEVEFEFTGDGTMGLLRLGEVTGSYSGDELVGNWGNDVAANEGEQATPLLYTDLNFFNSPLSPSTLNSADFAIELKVRGALQNEVSGSITAPTIKITYGEGVEISHRSGSTWESGILKRAVSDGPSFKWVVVERTKVKRWNGNSWSGV